MKKYLRLLGFSFALTLMQMFLAYLFLGLKIFGKFNVFIGMRKLVEKTIILDKPYFFFLECMYRLFGASVMHAPGFNNALKIAFLAVLVINILVFCVFIDKITKVLKNENN